MRSLCRTLVLTAVLALGASLIAADHAALPNYRKHCAGCHGSDGKAQTRLGRKSGAKDLSDKQTQAKLSDAEVFKTIKEGRKNSKGEEKMEPFGDDLSDKEITDLVAYVRTLVK